MPRLLLKCQRLEGQPEHIGFDSWDTLSWPWGDDFQMCEDAEIRECIIYLRGARSLRIPLEWRARLPQVF